jgi:hypothetical protein
MRRLALVGALLAWAGAASAAQITVGAGSTVNFADAAVDLGCADLLVSGTLNTGSASVAQALDVTIASGGTLNGGSGTLDVTRDWDRIGTFSAGTGTVRFVDGCSTTSGTISDSNTFNDLVLTTSSGKQVFFQAGETTIVAGALTLSGASGNLLQIRSTSDGVEALLDLDQAATGTFIDVKDNHAVDQAVTLGPNSVDSGNATGWSLSGISLPVLSVFGLVMLGASLYLTGQRNLHRRAPRVL